MVTMKNIRLVDNQIWMDCYKEGKEEGYFSLVVDSRTYEIVSCSLERPSIYARQAVAKIAELNNAGSGLPTEAKSVWC